jgi:hypothetical protein
VVQARVQSWEAVVRLFLVIKIKPPFDGHDVELNQPAFFGRNELA